MQIQIRNDSVTIDGYVNAVERWSKPLYSPTGRFVEMVKEGAFSKALERNHNVLALLNHNEERVLGSQGDKTLELKEDTIGLRARLVSTDREVLEKAKERKFTGWSFGFRDTSDGVKLGEYNGLKSRELKDLELMEVSLLDENASPAYKGTSVSVRDEGGYIELRAMMEDIDFVDLTTREDDSDEKIKDEEKTEELSDEKSDENQRQDLSKIKLNLMMKKIEIERKRNYEY